MPAWKRILSCLFEMPVRRIDSPVNGPMTLALSSGMWKLSTRNAVYSFGTNYLSFKAAFQQLNILGNPHIERVLVLGWGIGSIADLLSGHPSIRRITGVEHDPQLVNLYRELDITHTFDVEVVCADASAFLTRDTGKYDLICSDVFVDDRTPESIMTGEYIRLLENRAVEGGWILFSKLQRNDADRAGNEQWAAQLRAAGIDWSDMHSRGNRIFSWQKK